LLHNPTPKNQHDEETSQKQLISIIISTKKFIKHIMHNSSVGAGFIFLRFFRILFFLIGVTTRFVRKDNG
jgi:hypothetical protein|tara:strand:+ start:153 stop:362 length:210 start_codon:yes stop_codon:yes gene_type:complete